jgi:hypothetical protein
MHGPRQGEHNSSHEQQATLQLTAAAQAALDFQNVPPTALESGDSQRSFLGGNGTVICDLTETSPEVGPKQYKFGFPTMIAAPDGPRLVGLEAEWAEGDSETKQTIVSGDRGAQSVVPFEPVSTERITAVLNRHVGDPSKNTEGRAQRLRGKLGRLLGRS